MDHTMVVSQERREEVRGTAINMLYHWSHTDPELIFQSETETSYPNIQFKVGPYVYCCMVSLWDISISRMDDPPSFSKAERVACFTIAQPEEAVMACMSLRA